MVVGVGFVLFFYAHEVVAQSSFHLFWSATNNSPIAFFDVFVFGKEAVHAFEGFACFGKYDDTADRTVEAVSYATKYIAGFVVFLFEVAFDGFG